MVLGPPLMALFKESRSWYLNTQVLTFVERVVIMPAFFLLLLLVVAYFLKKK